MCVWGGGAGGGLDVGACGSGKGVNGQPYKLNCCSDICPFMCSVFSKAILIDIYSLRKHAYSNIVKISPPKTENFQIKISDIFQISVQNIDCGYSLEPPR